MRILRPVLAMMGGWRSPEDGGGGGGDAPRATLGGPRPGSEGAIMQAAREDMLASLEAGFPDGGVDLSDGDDDGVVGDDLGLDDGDIGGEASGDPPPGRQAEDKPPAEPRAPKGEPAPEGEGKPPADFSRIDQLLGRKPAEAQPPAGEAAPPSSEAPSGAPGWTPEARLEWDNLLADHGAAGAPAAAMAENARLRAREQELLDLGAAAWEAAAQMLGEPAGGKVEDEAAHIERLALEQAREIYGADLEDLEELDRPGIVKLLRDNARMAYEKTKGEGSAKQREWREKRDQIIAQRGENMAAFAKAADERMKPFAKAIGDDSLLDMFAYSHINSPEGPDSLAQRFEDAKKARSEAVAKFLGSPRVVEDTVVMGAALKAVLNDEKLRDELASDLFKREAAKNAPGGLGRLSQPEGGGGGGFQSKGLGGPPPQAAGGSGGPKPGEPGGRPLTEREIFARAEKEIAEMVGG